MLGKVLSGGFGPLGGQKKGLRGGQGDSLLAYDPAMVKKSFRAEPLKRGRDWP